MTLKTLKDLAYVDENGVEELREAGKKWITHIWGNVGLVTFKGARKDVIPVNEMMKLNAQIDWINMFFNLEDEG